MNRFSNTTPTRTKETEAAYERTYLWLKRRFGKQASKDDITPDEVVAQLLELRPSLSMKSFIAYKAAVMFYLNTHEPSFETAITVLSETSSIGLRKRSNKTSGKKIKQVPEHILNDLRKTNSDRNKNGYKHAAALSAYMESTLLTGLRPNEWAGAEIGKHAATGRPVLKVINSKHTNGRANGEERELFIDGLADAEVKQLEIAIQYFKAAPSLESALLALKHEIETTRMLALGKTSDWRTGVTLYSFRHQFVADAKATFTDPVIVAAAVGHYNTKTAFEHYGARRHGRTKVKVMPTPESVQAVQKRTLVTYEHFVAQRGHTATPTL